MRLEHQKSKAVHVGSGVRNPFGVMDVPNPEDQEVMDFASGAKLSGSTHDENAKAWEMAGSAGPDDAIDGNWFSRWNGGADPTIAGDAKDKWKQGQAKVQTVGERVYLHFNWDNAARQGLIEARRDGRRMVGKYINLSDPSVTQPWIGLIVNEERIDGRWPAGRLDFRR
ncbi:MULTISPECIES: hypothetical protein [Mesorhizobium]|uniref:Uncharacterized protein n=4 Tax=Mesorhizobium TaxID=68287 RepID=A0A1A5HPR4_RHILI|nr:MULTISPECIES: hypothetical protein [Mesorhizobium]MBE1711971.1 hypothetical protein [Mesorhizobium japonicum]MBE1717615.1 hypothetical protein [Mesorhizobium japonicum]MUT23522.1 hypothetical protein [Mesorhizobium japonicum]MUT30314.1 hypothetical protein [Mesorhizobium japonicum]OBP68943.1 hypothetical protein BAE41_21250 [Mesorhizobium loti]